VADCSSSARRLRRSVCQWPLTMALNTRDFCSHCVRAVVRLQHPARASILEACRQRTA
jgi:hypothetical protein